MTDDGKQPSVRSFSRSATLPEKPRGQMFTQRFYIHHSALPCLDQILQSQEQHARQLKRVIADQ